MRLLVTVPSPHLLYAKYVNRWLDWIREFEVSSSNKVDLWLETTPNRMDVSISKCIERAKKLRPAWWIRLDADIWPESSLTEMFGFAIENAQAGFEVTCCPTMDRSGVLQVERVQHLDPDPDAPFECDWASGSLVFTPMKVLDRMRPLGKYEQEDPASPGLMHTMPLYISTEGLYERIRANPLLFYIAEQRPKTTEDYDFCERVRALGFKVCSDPRVLARQMRPEVGIPSFRKGMHIGQSLELQLSGPVKA